MKAITNLLRLALFSVSTILFIHATAGFGATAIVLVGSGGLVFVPAITNIAVNDTVTWTWSGSFHSTTSGTVSGTTATANGLWDSGVNNAPHAFSQSFANAGTFPYYCSFHFGSGMKGSIIVTAPAVPPTVTITNPASGTTLSAPASLTLAAIATSTTGNITNVQFWQGTTLLGNIAPAPFSIPVTSLTAADYTFSAIANNSSGLTATNSIIVHVVDVNPVTVSAPDFLPPADFQFTYTADVGLTYVVQVSTNLFDWNSINTNLAISSQVIFTDPSAGNTGAFYRVGRLPNP